MKLKISFILFVIGICFGFTNYLYKSSTGAPASHSGAPDEGTCAHSGCHDDRAINSGSAHLELKLNQNKLEAGRIYTLSIYISDQGINRFGFQLLALNQIGKTNSGEFILLDSVRTQIIRNHHKLKDRKYLTYTFNGTDTTKTEFAEWFVLWKSPENISGPVNFYLAGVAANDDMTDKGDNVYTYSLSLTSK